MKLTFAECTIWSTMENSNNLNTNLNSIVYWIFFFWKNWIFTPSSVILYISIGTNSACFIYQCILHQRLHIRRMSIYVVSRTLPQSDFFATLAKMGLGWIGSGVFGIWCDLLEERAIGFLTNQFKSNRNIQYLRKNISTATTSKSNFTSK